MMAYIVLYIAIFLALVGVILVSFYYAVLKWAMPRFERLLGQSDRTSLVELFFGLRTTTLPELLFTLQRAQSGKPAQHAMGSPVRHPLLDDFAWDPATLQPRPLQRRHTVDTTVILGPRAKRPLMLALPILIAPMGYGIALNWETKVAFAQAAALAGIATNSGEGPFLPAERAYASRWILQFGRGPWNHQTAAIRQADMVEVQVGQGSEAGTGVYKLPRTLPRRVRQATDHPRRGLRIRAHFPAPIPRIIAQIRRINPHIPIGIKLPASNHLERDLALLVRWGVDIVTLDGAEAATAGSPAVISDHFGIPTAQAVIRANQWLKGSGHRDAMSVVASGGARSASDIAKLLALGADAVVIGTALLFAASHEQTSRVLARYGPSRLVFATPHLPRQQTLDVDIAAEHAVKWIKATRAELQLLSQAVGVDHVHQLAPHHLLARSDYARCLLTNARVKTPHSWALLGQLAGMTQSYEQLNAVLDHLLVDIHQLYSHAHPPAAAYHVTQLL